METIPVEIISQIIQYITCSNLLIMELKFVSKYFEKIIKMIPIPHLLVCYDFRDLKLYPFNNLRFKSMISNKNLKQLLSYNDKFETMIFPKKYRLDSNGLELVSKFTCLKNLHIKSGLYGTIYNSNLRHDNNWNLLSGLKLQSLTLNDCPESCLHVLSGLRLHLLTLSCTSVSCFEILSSGIITQSLEKLIIKMLLSHDEIKYLPNFIKLKMLDITFNNRISSYHIHNPFQYLSDCKMLEELYINEYVFLNHNHLKSFSNCKQLKILGIKDLGNIEDDDDSGWLQLLSNKSIKLIIIEDEKDAISADCRMKLDSQTTFFIYGHPWGISRSIRMSLSINDRLKYVSS